LGGKNSLQPALIAQGVAAPIIISDGRAMATSSDAHTTFSQDHRYHHILNPHTGYSPSQWSSVTVLASSCVVADALTKVFFMLPPSQINSAARRWRVDVVLQDKAGKWRATTGVKVRAVNAA
jgi:thiamine biosynthesis lipoprotein